MNQIVAEPKLLPPIHLDGEVRIAINGLTYKFYKQFCEEIGEQPIRLSFSDGCLEIMITKSPHEYFKKMLAKLVEAMIFELDIPVRSGGAMTFQRDDLEKGFEPDECWWIANESIVRKVTDFDFYKHPAPDLAIEVEISHGLSHRIGIYQAMKVAEVWRFNTKRLRFCVLSDAGQYVESASSRAFPFLKPEHLMPFLALPDEQDETSRIRAFVKWLQAERVCRKIVGVNTNNQIEMM
jgi:Uma2 family endonuclease